MNRIIILKKATSILLLNKVFPLSVNFSLTDRCNLNCGYCETASRNLKELALEDIFYIIGQLRKCGCQRIGFTGGEPLLRKDIKAIIDYAKNCRIFTTLSTNGVLIKEKINDIEGLDILNISFNGPEHIHNIQSGSDSFKEVMDGIKIAKEHGLKVYTLTVLTQYNTNVKCIDFILSTAKKMGFSCFFQPICDSRLTLNEKKWPLPDREEFLNTIDYLISQKKRDYPVNNSLSGLMYFRENWPKPNKKIKCLSGKCIFYIDTDGKFYSCLAMVKYKDYVDIFNEDLSKTLKVKKFKSPLSCFCWCSTFTELNLAFSCRMDAISNIWQLLS